MCGYALLLALAIVVSSFLTFSSDSALACTCVPVEEQRKSAEAIFAGKVDEIMKMENNQLIKFTTEKAWRGVPEKEVTVTNHIFPAGTCGSVHFEVGMEYLVYAYGDLEGLGVGGCSRVIAMNHDQAQADIEILGPSYVPADVRSDFVIVDSGIGPLPVIFGIGAAVAAVIAFLTLRRRS